MQNENYFQLCFKVLNTYSLCISKFYYYTKFQHSTVLISNIQMWSNKKEHNKKIGRNLDLKIGHVSFFFAWINFKIVWNNWRVFSLFYLPIVFFSWLILGLKFRFLWYLNFWIFLYVRYFKKIMRHICRVCVYQLTWLRWNRILINFFFKSMWFVHNMNFFSFTLHKFGCVTYFLISIIILIEYMFWLIFIYLITYFKLNFKFRFFFNFCIRFVCQ